MADNFPSKKSQNKAFLDQLDRQRANKPCIRIIDLRGKVAGECQAYNFGDRTHYLDDRAYLITKKLLDRYDGRYTIGVYETLMSALKKLAEIKENEIQDDNTEFNFKRLPFDHQLDRKELRIIYATPIEINVGDVRYSATTMNITTSAIKVSLKRAHALEKDSTVFINFLELESPEDNKLLSDVKFKILRVDHRELRTQLILVRNNLENKTLTDWFNDWCIKHNAGEHLDLDNELFNIMTEYYLRLYSTSLTSSLYWLSNTDDLEPIKAFHRSENADNSLHSLLKYQYNLKASPLPFQQLMSDKCDYLLLLTIENNESKRYIARRDDKKALSQLLHHQSQFQHEDNILILLKTRDLSIPLESYEQELHQIASIDAAYSSSLQQRLSEISRIVSVTNITPCLQNIIPVKNDTNPTASLPEENQKIPFPTYLRHHIQYHEQRFLIKTKIHLHYYGNEEALEVTTTDVSNEGLSFTLSESIDVKIGDNVKIDFSHWQKQSPKSKLSKLPFIVRNLRSTPSEFRIGFERNKKQCHPNTNTFFMKTIEHNKEKLFENNQDLFISQEAKIFSSLLGQNLSNIPFYLAVDPEGKRVLQAVSTTELNKSHELNGLWQALQPHVILISGRLNDLSSDAGHHSISFGLYCHEDKSGVWQIQADYNLETTVQKTVVINQASRRKNHAFYHCTITPITSDVTEKEGDLNRRLAQFQGSNRHKTKQIRNELKNLFAVGELINITDIISAATH